MMTFCCRLVRRGMPLALALILGATSALAQQAKEPPPKEPTDGFFDVPARDPSEVSEDIGLPAYLVTAFLASGAIFIVCKSARRS